MSKDKPLLTTTDAILAQLNFIRNKKQEYVVCLSLDSAQRLIVRRVVTIGLLDVSLAHPREVFAGPIKDRAASIIVAHNHPSGDPSPSKHDIETTQQLAAAAHLLGLTLHDHVILTRNHFYSFKHTHYL